MIRAATAADVPALTAICNEGIAGARIFTTNAASRAVHLAAGFEEVGVQRRTRRMSSDAAIGSTRRHSS